MGRRSRKLWAVLQQHETFSASDADRSFEHDALAQAAGEGRRAEGLSIKQSYRHVGRRLRMHSSRMPLPAR